MASRQIRNQKQEHLKAIAKKILELLHFDDTHTHFSTDIYIYFR